MSGFTVEPLPRMRQLVADIGWISKQSDPIIGLLEIDVTEARRRIREQENMTGVRLSFTAFLIHCMARAVDEHKHVHAILDWRKRLIIYDDVDVTTMIEIETDGLKIPVGHIIRGANHKTLVQLHDEIRGVQSSQKDSEAAAAVMLYTRFPSFLRRWVFRVIIGFPHIVKQMRGTVVITAVGMFGQRGGWAIGLPSHSLTVLVGGVIEKPGVVDGQICVREYLHMTLGFDHRVVDGAPAARFAVCLQNLIEQAYGL